MEPGATSSVPYRYPQTRTHLPLLLGQSSIPPRTSENRFDWTAMRSKALSAEDTLGLSQNLFSWGQGPVCCPDSSKPCSSSLIQETGAYGTYASEGSQVISPFLQVFGLNRTRANKAVRSTDAETNPALTPPYQRERHPSSAMNKGQIHP